MSRVKILVRLLAVLGVLIAGALVPPEPALAVPPCAHAPPSVHPRGVEAIVFATPVASVLCAYLDSSRSVGFRGGGVTRSVEAPRGSEPAVPWPILDSEERR